MIALPFMIPFKADITITKGDRKKNKSGNKIAQ